jgi:hypothetical protein
VRRRGGTSSVGRAIERVLHDHRVDDLDGLGVVADGHQAQRAIELDGLPLGTGGRLGHETVQHVERAAILADA